METSESGFYEDGELAAVALSGTLNTREMSEVTTTAAKLAGLAEATGGGMFWSAPSPGAPPGNPQLPRVTMLGAAHVLHGTDWLGLKDRNAHVVTGAQSIPFAAGLGPGPAARPHHPRLVARRPLKRRMESIHFARIP